MRHVLLWIGVLALLSGGMLWATSAAWAAQDVPPTPTPNQIFLPAVSTSHSDAPQPDDSIIPVAWRVFFQRYGSPILLVLAVIAWIAVRIAKRRLGR